MSEVETLEIDRDTALAIISGMYEMANADNDFDSREKDLILKFLEENTKLTLEEFEALEGEFQLNKQFHAFFLTSITMVALADGTIKEAERALLDSYIERFDFESSSQEIINQVGFGALSLFRGTQTFRSQAIEMGHALGMSEDAIEEALFVPES
jgi:tellurite resistance protein